jgi:hypothetical protein
MVEAFRRDRSLNSPEGSLDGAGTMDSEIMDNGRHVAAARGK